MGDNMNESDTKPPSKTKDSEGDRSRIKYNGANSWHLHWLSVRHTGYPACLVIRGTIGYDSLYINPPLDLVY